jgi:hypothetical protein
VDCWLMSEISDKNFFCERTDEKKNWSRDIPCNIFEFRALKNKIKIKRLCEILSTVWMPEQRNLCARQEASVAPYLT